MAGASKDGVTTTRSTKWWQAPEEGEEYHTPHVWHSIAMAALNAGDLDRYREARDAAAFESRLAGAE